MKQSKISFFLPQKPATIKKLQNREKTKLYDDENEKEEWIDLCKKDDDRTGTEKEKTGVKTEKSAKISREKREREEEGQEPLKRTQHRTAKRKKDVEEEEKEEEEQEEKTTNFNHLLLQREMGRRGFVRYVEYPYSFRFQSVSLLQFC